MGHRAVIAEEIEHARELDDLDAVQNDEFGLDEYIPDHGQSLLINGMYSTPSPAHPQPPMDEASITRPKEAHMHGSLVTVRPGSSRKKGMPPRLTAEPSQTFAPNPSTRSREDRELLEREPIDPTTRKAARVEPEEAHLVRVGA